jgi:DNA-binding response OmpR family regulator
VSAARTRPRMSIKLDGDQPDGKILLVEASPSPGGELAEQLRADRFQTVVARSSEHARVLAASHTLRVAVLGQLEPPRGTLDLLEEIRRGCETPATRALWDTRLPAIVIGSGAGQLELLRAFDAGADDFVAAPVSYLELRARLRALLQRAESALDTPIVSVGSLAIDTAAHTVSFSGVQVELCRLEYELLVYLARRPTTVCSKHELLSAIWRRHSGDRGARTLDSHASRLRRKLGAVGADGFVVNVWGIGYRLL